MFPIHTSNSSCYPLVVAKFAIASRSRKQKRRVNTHREGCKTDPGVLLIGITWFLTFKFVAISSFHVSVFAHSRRTSLHRSVLRLRSGIGVFRRGQGVAAAAADTEQHAGQNTTLRTD